MRKIVKALVTLFLAAMVSIGVRQGWHALVAGQPQPSAVEISNRTAEVGKVVGPLIGPAVSKVAAVGKDVAGQAGDAIRTGNLPSAKAVRGTSQVPIVLIVLAVLFMGFLIVTSVSRQKHRETSGRRKGRRR